MAPSQKPLTPAEIASLEHAFATDPGSEAYRPLTEAYLASSRFMEAMVVCKKGVKAHPDDPAARVLLSRVYADQGKDKKALEELLGVLAAFPTFAAANRLAAVLHFRLGDWGAGEAALRKAAEAAPEDPETLALLEKHGVKLAPPPPPSAPRPLGRPISGPGAPPVAPRITPSASGTPPPLADGVEHSVEVPIPTPVPTRRARDIAMAEALAEKYGTKEFELAGGGKKKRIGDGAVLEVGDHPGQGRRLPRREAVPGRAVDGPCGIAVGQDRVHHPRQTQPLPVLRGEQPRHPDTVQVVDLGRHDRPAATAVDPNVARTPCRQRRDQVLEELDVPTLVGADGDRVHILLHRGDRDLVD